MAKQQCTLDTVCNFKNSLIIAYHTVKVDCRNPRQILIRQHSQSFQRMINWIVILLCDYDLAECVFYVLFFIWYINITIIILYENGIVSQYKNFYDFLQ